MQLAFRKLYAESTRQQGTLRYFREKFNRRKVCQRVKHYEDCEQLFDSVGKMHIIEAALTFFGMEGRNDSPRKNVPPSVFLLTEEQKQNFYHSSMERFVDEYIWVERDGLDESNDAAKQYDQPPDKVIAYALNLLRHFIILADLRDAVREGHGEHLATLSKLLLLHFKSHKGFNTYSIEMLLNIVQNEVFLSERQASQCKWAATSNWKGGPGKNIEIYLMQEKTNHIQKKLIKTMGANKTAKAISRASTAAGGITEIIENMDNLTKVKLPSSDHSRRRSFEDEMKILADLRKLKQFVQQNGRAHASFARINEDPLATLDEEELNRWLARHERNLTTGYHACRFRSRI